MPGKRVFIVEDEEPLLTSLKKLLNLSGFEADGTTQPKEAVALIKNFKPNVILLDLLMPKLGGLEICDILNKDKDTENIPIIVISALASYTDVKRAYLLGVIDYVTKPYDLNQLIEKINKAIESKSK